jgi:hypothetical protein
MLASSLRGGVGTCAERHGHHATSAESSATPTAPASAHGIARDHVNLGAVGGSARTPLSRGRSLLAAHFNSRIKSRADCQRSSGSLARHVDTMRSRDAGAPFGELWASGIACETAGGSSFKIAPMRLARVLPSNAFRPVSISNSTHPNAKMSVRASASIPSICSGAMY